MKALGALIAIIILIGAFFYLIGHSDDYLTETNNGTHATTTVATSTRNATTTGTSTNIDVDVNIENYVRQSISALSQVREQLGGKFYVTAVEAHNGKGTVHYEDGHSAYVADFTYTVDASGKISVTSFKIRP